MSFLKLKELLTIASLLTPLAKDVGFMVYCNSSSIGLGCMLMKLGYIITYVLRQLGYISAITKLMTWSRWR